MSFFDNQPGYNYFIFECQECSLSNSPVRGTFKGFKLCNDKWMVRVSGQESGIYQIEFSINGISLTRIPLPGENESSTTSLPQVIHISPSRFSRQYPVKLDDFDCYLSGEKSNYTIGTQMEHHGSSGLIPFGRIKLFPQETTEWLEA